MNKPRKPRSPVQGKKKAPITTAEKGPGISDAAKETMKAPELPTSLVDKYANDKADPPADREPRRELTEGEKRDPRETSTRDEELSIEEMRRTRIPIGRRSRLDALAAPHLRPGFYHRYVLDKPGRLETHSLASYDFVLDGNGKHITFPTGTSHLHLMRLPQVFRDEDLAERKQKNAMRLTKEIEVGPGEYVPEDAAGVLVEESQFIPND